MRLTKIEMIGFKSFVEKTQIPINEGLTAIVGPNGCGKSNIADAVRWVIGEQSAKTLRGERMEDVIFSGSPKRKPIGYAEVTLTLARTNGSSGNGDALAGNGGTLRCHSEAAAEESRFSRSGQAPQEIEITRRLYRSGESEYLMNKTPCRLKDISDMLMDAGLGTRAYALIEQGKVEEVVSMKPAERRLLVEDAAGILKYKNQKRIAQGKLESSLANLARVEDILAEIERQLNSLDRQAKKARRHQALTQELRTLELAQLYQETGEQIEQEKAVAAQHEAQKNEEIRERSTWNTLAAQKEELSLKEAEAQNLLNQKREDLYKAQNQMNQEEGELSWERERSQSLGQKIRETESRLDLLTKLRGELESQTREEENRAAETSRTLTEKETQLALLQQERRELTQRLKDMRAQQEEQKKRVFEEALLLSQQKNRLTALEERKRELNKKNTRHQEALQELSALKDSLHNQGRELAARKQRLEETLSALKAEQAELEDKISSREEEAAALEVQRAAFKEELAALTAQKQTLQELEDKLEGCLPGTQALWEAREQKAGFNGILTPVVQDLNCDSSLEKAYAALLGEILGGLWLEASDRLLAAVEFLNQERGGRAVLVPRDLLGAKVNPPLPSLEGVVGWAGDLIGGEGEIKAPLSRLLGGALIVKDLSVALKVRDQHPEILTVATLAGELLSSSGAVWVGDKEVPPLMSRPRKLSELQATGEEKEEKLKALENSWAQIKTELGQIKAALDKIEFQQEELLADSTRILQEESLLKSEGQRCQRQEDFLQQEGRQLETEGQEMLAQENEITEQVARLQRTLEEKEEKLAQIEKELEALLPREQEFIQKEHQLSVEVAQLQERKNQSLRELGRLGREKEKAREESQNGEREKAQLEEEVQTVAASIGGKEQSLREKIEILGRRKEELGGLENIFAEIKQQREAREVQLRAQEQVLDERSARVKELELARARLEVTLSHLYNRLAAEYQLTWEELQKSPPAPEAAAEPLSSRIAAVKTKIENLGLVNMAALEEFEQEQKRYQFLCGQRDDILASIDSLHQVINKMDQTSKALFSDTFQAVNQRFGEVYQRLFRGGQACLVLVNPQDLLESGVDIEVQLPGKTLQNISLLSGGEKALASLSLLFSLFLTKPAPFCILDEADAPLDDANVERYVEILREMAQSAQFIIITHNKRTMEWANVLYGVTMEEPGVSKIISVKFNGNNGKGESSG